MSLIGILLLLVVGAVLLYVAVAGTLGTILHIVGIVCVILGVVFAIVWIGEMVTGHRL